jgi:hypothetical protein
MHEESSVCPRLILDSLSAGVFEGGALWRLLDSVELLNGVRDCKLHKMLLLPRTEVALRVRKPELADLKGPLFPALL